MRSCLEWGDGRICGLEGRKRMENGQYGQMDINAILAQVDALYEADKGEEAEQLMLRSLEEAAGKREDGVRLQL